MASSQGKHMPKDTQVIVSILKDLGIEDFDHQVLNHLLEFNYRYTTLLLDDAKTYSNFAKKKNVDVDDVKLAIRLARDGVFFRPPTPDVLNAASNEVNKIQLPEVKPTNGLRIPHDRANFLQTNYKLKTDLLPSGSIRKIDMKATAAKILETSKKTDMENNVFTQSDQIMGDSMDFDMQEIIENQQNNQESAEENSKDEHMDTQTYEDRVYTDIALDDSEEKPPNDL